MENNAYTEIGAIWDNEGKLSGQLENGIRFYIHFNDQWEEGSKKPKYRVRALTENARQMGIEPKSYSNDLPSL
jgi:hypothetical protein